MTDHTGLPGAAAAPATDAQPPFVRTQHELTILRMKRGLRWVGQHSGTKHTLREACGSPRPDRSV